jgi:hypothetical protein
MQMTKTCFVNFWLKGAVCITAVQIDWLRIYNIHISLSNNYSYSCFICHCYYTSVWWPYHSHSCNSQPPTWQLCEFFEVSTKNKWHLIQDHFYILTIFLVVTTAPTSAACEIRTKLRIEHANSVYTLKIKVWHCAELTPNEWALRIEVDRLNWVSCHDKDV